MRAVVSFSECLSDSPKFRSALQQNETNLDELELRLEKMIKLCSAMTEGGRMYVTQQVMYAVDAFDHC
jgi:Arf-GAP/coiled-coil/ANK repeat/PH domain-containing protein